MSRTPPSSSHAPPPIDAALAILARERSPQRRRWHAALLVANASVVAVVLALWTTEPGPLPTRLHVAFAALVAIGLAWIVTLLWLRTRRAALLVDDRVALARVAVAASLTFALIGTGIAIARAEPRAAWAVGGVGVTFLLVAGGLLVRATRDRRTLRTLRARLEAGA